MTPLTDIERDKLILASARGMQWLLQRTPDGLNSLVIEELDDALKEFPIIREAPPR